jgi:AcrR family transcriptional regulator
MELDSGRSQQKYRTRRALLAAAKQLMDQNLAVTVQAAADTAQISRATAYRYFTTPEALMREALLDADWADPSTVIGDATDVRERVRRVCAYLYEFTERNETAHRLFLAKALETWVARAGQSTASLRGARRLPMYELALEPLGKTHSVDARRELVLRLSAASGIETFIALKDVCGVDTGTARLMAERNILAILNDAIQ